MKRYIVSALCLILILFIASQIQNKTSCSMDFQKEQLVITGPENTDPIILDYRNVRSVALLESYTAGELISGISNRRLNFGKYKNDLYGEYSLCAVPSIPTAIEIQTDSEVIVFNYESAEVTDKLCDTLQSFIAQKQQ